MTNYGIMALSVNIKSFLTVISRFECISRHWVVRDVLTGIDKKVPALAPSKKKELQLHHLIRETIYSDYSSGLCTSDDPNAKTKTYIGPKYLGEC